MSVKLEVYQAIKERLESIEGMKNVSHYNGQDLFNYEKDHLRRFPQSWISFSGIQWNDSELTAYNENVTQQQKTITAEITVRYAMFSLKDDDDTFEIDLQNIDTIYRAITNLSGDNFTPLQRSVEVETANNNNVRVWITTFTTMLTECGEDKGQSDAAPLSLILNTSYE